MADPAAAGVCAGGNARFVLHGKHMVRGGGANDPLLAWPTVCGCGITRSFSPLGSILNEKGRADVAEGI